MVDLVEDARSLPLESLACRCSEQTASFYHGRNSDTSYCFEIFRRAILEKNQAAWEVIFQVYSDQVIRWVRSHRGFSATGEEERYFANRALEKFWQAIPSERFSLFPDLQHLLRYLKACVYSVISDYCRAEDESAWLVDVGEAEDLPEPVSVEAWVEDRNQAQNLWVMITERLRDLKEVQVAYDSFVLGLKPADMLERSPGSYGSIKEIYRVKENILDRLRNDQPLMNLLGITVESEG